jgi:PqqA peptide cyclase
MSADMASAGRPTAMLAELTHRCPLGCPYCSNPLELERRSGELATEDWVRVFREAAELGVLQLHLSGGEPTARRDIRQLVAAAHDAGLYTNMITSGVLMNDGGLDDLLEDGLDHVQISLQDVEPETSDWIAGFRGGHAKKLALARAVRERGVPLTLNCVVHRHNIDHVGDFIDLALELDAARVEIAHVQYYGWALANRAALMPTREATMEAHELVLRRREELKGRLVIDAVVPDYYARYPKPCMGGWGKVSLNVTPSGKVLPCHAAESLPGLEFWSVRDRALADIWMHAPAFNAFRGTDWMEEPCRSCERREVDWGGCRCQAYALTGRVTATDPTCVKSALHDEMAALATEESAAEAPEFNYRRLSRV